ncbi:MAG: rod shape-determining protein RodA [Bacteroidales bacterium]|nr:rod shape-determining protein RodA [Bacteroidales bacterium]MCF8333506.1 rod shape-determining protein RodA [Bacteroidales bacterium]
MTSRRNIFANVDWFTVFLFILIAFFGWLNIYASLYEDTQHGILDFSRRYGKQLIWIGFSGIIAFFILLIDAKVYENFSFIFYLSVLLLLAAVLLFGTEVAGSKSWFRIGGVAIQPAEFAKFATALALAKYLAQRQVNLLKIHYLARAAFILLIPAFLIFLQNDTGSALVFLAFILVLFREGMSGSLLGFLALFVMLFIFTLLFGKWEVFYALAGLAILAVILYRKQIRNIGIIIAFLLISSGFSFGVDYAFANFLEPHQRTRIKVLLGQEIDNRGSGYNLHQSKIAIGSGGVAGKGFLEGTQTKYDFVPEQETDFIFCTVGEEWGFIGTSGLIALYVILLGRLIMIAERQRSDFSRIYGYGVISILFFHFAINIGMTIGMVPVIGIPLPFFSYGGSSLWSFTILLFIFLKLDSNRMNVL